MDELFDLCKFKIEYYQYQVQKKIFVYNLRVFQNQQQLQQNIFIRFIFCLKSKMKSKLKISASADNKANFSKTFYNKKSPQQRSTTIKRSLTENRIQKTKKDIIQNQQDIKQILKHNSPSPKKKSNKLTFGIDRSIIFKHTQLQKINENNGKSILKLKKDSHIQNNSQQKQQLIKTQKDKQKLNQKIVNHRRIRSSSKISSRIIQLNDYFKDPNTGSSRVTNCRINTQMTQSKLAQQCLQNILQLKLRTECQSNETNNQLLSFRNTVSSAGNSRTFGFTFGSNLHKISKLSDILSKHQLDNSKQLIKINEQMRKNNNLIPNPKQWHFHNCLSLQKIQLYSTNLKISCEGWVALDHLQLKYLRGWNPKVLDEFSPLIRLFIAKISYDLPQIANYPLDIDRLLIRVNDKHIYKDQRQKIKEKGQKVKGINPHSILSLKKLVTAVLLTCHDDLVVYSIIALGYILYLIKTNTKLNIRQQGDPLHQLKKSQFHEIYVQTTERSILQLYCQYFQRQCQNICRELDLSTTRVIVGFSCLYNQYSKKYKNRHHNLHQYTVSSSSLDMSVLFMKCLSDKNFKEALSHRIYETQIKYQVGWNFWETRKQKWSNQQYIKYRLKAVGGRTNKGNQCFAVWDDQRDILITMADCKINMHWKDTERIQDWIQKHINRFSKQYSLSMTFIPCDSQKFLKIN